MIVHLVSNPLSCLMQLTGLSTGLGMYQFISTDQHKSNNIKSLFYYKLT